jgi:acyl carrier protein/pimeloyl-ACP methyl ester carboxylesterase
MGELNDKLERLSDADRVRLYRELLDRSDEMPPPSVKELVLVYEEGSGATSEALRDAAESRLAEHERPARFIATGSLPRTPHGKLDRRGLPGLVRREQPTTQQYDATQIGASGVMSSAVATFSKVLGDANVGPDSNFFELGGHSLLAVDCILEFEESTGERISITEFLNHPTPRGIAALINQQSNHKYQHIYPVSENTSGLPVLVFSSARLAYALKPRKENWSIYGVQFRWRDENDREIQYDSVQDMARQIAAEIRHLCADDEFLLVGSSFSAMVAYEVANHLRSEGIEPKLTILVEPSLLHSRRTWFELDLGSTGQLRQGDNPYLRWVLLNNPFRAQFWRRVAEQSSKRQDGTPSDSASPGVSKASRAYEVARAKSLRRHYRPSHFAGTSVLFAGSDVSWLVCRDWETRLGQGCTVHILDTDHDGILRDPFMSDVVIPIIIKEASKELA